MSGTHPGIRVMSVELARTALDSAKNIAKNQPIFCDALTVTYRISLCKSCEFFSAENTRCGKCGCYMNAKTKLQAAKCPVGKW